MKPYAFFARAALVCAASGLLAACGGDDSADENGNSQPPASPAPTNPSPSNPSNPSSPSTPANPVNPSPTNPTNPPNPSTPVNPAPTTPTTPTTPAPNLDPTKASSAGSTWRIQNHASSKEDLVCLRVQSLSGTGSMYLKYVLILEPVAGSKDVQDITVATWHEDSACQGSPVAEWVIEMVRRYQKTDGAPKHSTVTVNGVTTKLDSTTMFDFYEMVSRVETVRNLKTGATEVIRRGLQTNLEFYLPCDGKDRTIAGLHFDGAYFDGGFMCTEKADRYTGVSHVATYIEPTGNTLFEMDIFSNWRGEDDGWEGPSVMFRVQ